jgi:hypothetical protein
MKKDATRPDILHPSFDRERGACPAALWRCPSTASAALAAALHRPLVARNGETSREARPGLENSLWPFCFSLVTRIALPLTSQSHGNPASAILLCTPRQSNMAFVLSDAGRSSVSFRSSILYQAVIQFHQNFKFTALTRTGPPSPSSMWTAHKLSERLVTGRCSKQRSLYTEPGQAQ